MEVKASTFCGAGYAAQSTDSRMCAPAQLNTLLLTTACCQRIWWFATGSDLDGAELRPAAAFCCLPMGLTKPQNYYLPPDLSTRSSNPSAPKCPRSTFMQHYQVPSAEYTYINHVISLGLADDYTAQLRASCSPNSPSSLRAASDQACRHLSGVVDDLQPVLASAPGVHSLETLGQQNGAPVSDAAVGSAAAMLNTLEEEARILQLTQLTNARHGAAKPQNTVQAEESAAALEGRRCMAFTPVLMAPLRLPRPCHSDACDPAEIL